jgi:hypothetical protein
MTSKKGNGESNGNGTGESNGGGGKTGAMQLHLFCKIADCES